jgi:hypothetical protein
LLPDRIFLCFGSSLFCSFTISVATFGFCMLSELRLLYVPATTFYRPKNGPLFPKLL